VSGEAASGGNELRSFKRKLERAWIFSPERLWLLSIALHGRGRLRLAFLSADVALGHYSHGIVVNGGVRIGRRVKIWHNVTLTGRAARSSGAKAMGRAEILVEDGVKIGTNAVVIAKRGESLRIGRNARIGAGSIVTHDVPDGATVVSPSARVILREDASAGADAEGADGEGASAGGADAMAPSVAADTTKPSADIGSAAEP
jgi:acetyltransferase-like isoleucine patch superfamily enzyme